MRIIKIGNRNILSTGSLLLIVALLSFLIPTRGMIMGLSSANLLVMCCVCATVVFHKKPKYIPLFYWIYFIDMVICMIHHYSDRYPYVHFIEITQIIGLVYLTIISIRTKRDFNKIIDFIIFLFTIYAIFGIVESVGKFNIFDALTGTQVVYDYANGLRFGLARSRGACGTSINNGMLLVMILCLVTYRIFNFEKKRWQYNFSYIIIFINCFCTLSRAVWLEVCISQFLFFLIQRPGKQVKIVAKIFAGVVCMAVLLLIIQPSVVFGINTIINDMFGSIIGTLMGNSTSTVGDEGDRLLLWGWIWQTVKGSARWGLGYATKFSYLTPAGYVKESIEVMWLYRLYQIGFVGLFGYIFLQVSCLVYFGTNWLKEKLKQENLDFNCMMSILCIAYFITQFSCASSEDLRFFYFMLGLAFSFNKIRCEEIN